MLPTFCLRLACGLVGSLLLLSPAQVNPRFYRVHFLITLGLTMVAALFLRDLSDRWLRATLLGAVSAAFFGSLTWSLDRAPLGRTIIALTAVFLGTALVRLLCLTRFGQMTGWTLASELSSAALLGSSTTAMLMGHSYLIAPSMSLQPLLRLLAAFFISLLARALVAGVGVWFWTWEHSLTKLDDVTMLLPLRCGLGFVGPLVLGVMAWRTARIRSTQSATGILYVVVIFCFLGELMSQLLLEMTKGGLIS
jgi:hypothetical protein